MTDWRACGCLDFPQAFRWLQRGSVVTSDHDMLWSRCALLGRVVLPLLDQEPWRKARRHERLGAWGIDTVTGERLIEIFAAIAVHTVAVDTSLSPAQLDALPLKKVAEAATGKQDIEMFAGLPATFADEHDERAVKVFRLYAYKGGLYSLSLTRLSTELRHTLITLAEHSPTPSPTCADVFRRAAEAGLPGQPVWSLLGPMPLTLVGVPSGANESWKVKASRPGRWSPPYGPCRTGPELQTPSKHPSSPPSV